MKTLLVSLLMAAAVSAQADYANVLRDYVDDRGMVNYAGLLADRKPLDDFVLSLENQATDGWTEQDWIAFWINAYNARTLQVVIDHYPTEGIRKIPGAWKKLKAPILGKARTLDEIEHQVLRKDYREPRIHMALVCAAKSCPELRTEPYIGNRLNEQLSDQSREFLARSECFRLDGGRAYLSPIFKWFKKDFESVPDFIRNYSGEDISNLKIKYQSYDWSLNEQENK